MADEPPRSDSGGSVVVAGPIQLRPTRYPAELPVWQFELVESADEDVEDVRHWLTEWRPPPRRMPPFDPETPLTAELARASVGMDTETFARAYAVAFARPSVLRVPGRAGERQLTWEDAPIVARRLDEQLAAGGKSRSRGQTCMPPTWAIRPVRPCSAAWCPTARQPLRSYTPARTNGGSSRAPRRRSSSSSRPTWERRVVRSPPRSVEPARGTARSITNLQRLRRCVPLRTPTSRRATRCSR